MGKGIGDYMGLGVGQRQYNPPEQSINLRSVSAKRAAIIKWHHLHPHSFRLFKKADAELDKNFGKVRSYNETMQRLEKRIGKNSAARKKLPLVASLARVSNLMEIAEKNIAKQTKAREDLAQRLFDWRETLPQLDEQITLARKQPRE